jgi:hypothetical protein
MDDLQSLRQRFEELATAEKDGLDAFGCRCDRARDDLLRARSPPIASTATRIFMRYGAGVSSGSTSRPR